MTIAVSDVKFRKPAVITDTSANGGRKSNEEVLTAVRHGIFPRVTKAERTSGVTRYRKLFWSNENASDEIAYDVLLFLEFPSNGGDRFYIGKGTQLNTQGEIITTPPQWVGCGQLNSALSGGESSVDLAMEANDFEFINGEKFHLTNKFKTGQTVDSDVSIGDSVTFGGGTWSKIASTTDITYPNGMYVGGNVVMSEEAGTSTEEFLTISEKKTTDEDIGTGNGSDTNPPLTDLANITNGVVGHPDFAAVVTTVSGSVTRTVTIASDGTCSGYCDAGELNMTDGTWTTDINWTTAPDNTEDILITYYDKPYSYAANVVTVELSETVANAYATANTYGSGCIKFADEITPSFDDWVETTASGTYDESGTPPLLFNDGTEEDEWTVTFTSATAFTVTGLYAGSVGTGSVSSDFSPTNPNTGQPYFTLRSIGWGGTWAVSETVEFKTHPSAFPHWWKEIVPAATSAENNNLAVLGWYAE